ncbi:MAG: hypothetical protein N2C14_25780, partial [Planctomycetales bacterium]
RDFEGRIVQNKLGRVIGKQRLGYPVQIQLPGDANPRLRGRYRYTVHVDVEDRTLSSNVDLEGGESPELEISRDEDRLIHRRYEKGNPVFSQPVPEQPEATERFLLGAHRPIWDRTNLLFPISFQPLDETKFLRKPEELWIEIKPVVEKGSAPKYVFFERSYLPRRPVPVAGCVASGWPAAATHADVSVWWKNEKTEVGHQIPVGEVVGRRAASRGEFTIPGIPGVSYRVQIKPGQPPETPLRVIMLQNFSDKAEDLYVLKTEIHPAPDKLSRSYDARNRLVVHTFYFNEEDEASIRDFYRFRFTSRRSLQEDALRLAEPIRVRVPKMTGVIPFRVPE